MSRFYAELYLLYLVWFRSAVKGTLLVPFHATLYVLGPPSKLFVLEIYIKKCSHHNFLEPKEAALYFFLCMINSPEPKGSSFTIKDEKRKASNIKDMRSYNMRR